MKIFFDTEFTGLHKDTTLISIGLIDENGRSFYAELTDYDRDQVNDWIQSNVINNLKFKGRDNVKGMVPIERYVYFSGDKKSIRNYLLKWLDYYDDVQLVSDVCHYDMVLLIDLLATSALDLPDSITASCHDINQDIASYYGISERDAFDLSREQIISKNHKQVKGNKHNSLYDAKVIKEIYNIINK